MNKNMYWADLKEEKEFLANNKKFYSAEFIIYDEDMSEEYNHSDSGEFSSDKEALAWAESLKDCGAYHIILSCEDGGMWAI